MRSGKNIKIKNNIEHKKFDRVLNFFLTIEDRRLEKIKRAKK